MTTSERIGWLLALFLCVGLPLALDYGHPTREYRDLALAGGGALLLAWWLIAPWRGREGRS